MQKLVMKYSESELTSLMTDIDNFKDFDGCLKKVDNYFSLYNHVNLILKLKERTNNMDSLTHNIDHLKAQ